MAEAAELNWWYPAEEDEEEEYFPDGFREYIDRELNWWYPDRDSDPEGGWEGSRWVFWSRQDDPTTTTTIPYDSFVVPSTNLKLKDKIRDALQKMIVCPELNLSLVQFWSPTTTLDGWTLLTTQNQPFAVGKNDTIDRYGLCEYRMISKEYQFSVDGQSGEEQLGLIGRVYLHQLPESTPNVKYYSIKEYPQRDHALGCQIEASWALPVFENFSRLCVGVLELVSSISAAIAIWYRKSFMGNMYDVFQEQGLHCFDVWKHYELRSKDEKSYPHAAFREILSALKAVCEFHNLPLALTWVPCSHCNSLLRGKYLEYYHNGDFVYLGMASHGHHLRKGQGVVGRALSSPNLLYCSDVTQFSMVEYPLVHYAREFGLTACLAICLQSSCTTNDVYILEFFLPKSNNDGGNSWTSLSRILGTMQKEFQTMKLASGEELGEELSVEVINFQNGRKLHFFRRIHATSDQPSTDSIDNGINVDRAERNNFVVTGSQDEGRRCWAKKEKKAQDAKQKKEVEGTRKSLERQLKKSRVRIEIPIEDILQYSNMSRKDAASNLEISISTLKRVCRGHGIFRWPPRNLNKFSLSRTLHVNQEQIPQLINSDLPSNQASASVAHTTPRDSNMVTVRAKYINDLTIKFYMSLSSGLVELQQQVAKRLNLEAGTYYVKYIDEDGDCILIACDEDLQEYMHICGSQGSTSMMILLEPKQPITH